MLLSIRDYHIVTEKSIYFSGAVIFLRFIFPVKNSTINFLFLYDLIGLQNTTTKSSMKLNEDKRANNFSFSHHATFNTSAILSVAACIAYCFRYLLIS